MIPLTAPEERICVFACRWCALLGAERAGRQRLSLPSGLRLVPVACAGSVSADMVIAALVNGAAGVAVLGCHLGGCRHNDANRDAHARLSLLRDLLDTVGLDGRRLLLSWGTAHEAEEYARLMRRFADSLAALPPAPALAAAKAASPIKTDAPAAGLCKSAPRAHLASSPAEDAALRAAAAACFTESGPTKADPAESGQAVLGLQRTDFGLVPSLFTQKAELEKLVAGPKRPLAATAGRILRDRSNWAKGANKAETPGNLVEGGEERGLREAVLAAFPSGTLHVACRACDARALRELARMRQIPEATALIPIPCSPEQIAACACERPDWPQTSEEAASEAAASEAAASAEASAAPAASALAEGQEALGDVQKIFAGCVQCHWCRAACPVCVCPSCSLDDEASLPAASLPPSPLGYHLARAMHIADKCVGCGACEDACPQGLPLMALHRATARSLRHLGYASGKNMPSPVLEERRTEKAALAPPQWLTGMEASGGDKA